MNIRPSHVFYGYQKPSIYCLRSKYSSLKTLLPQSPPPSSGGYLLLLLRFPFRRLSPVEEKRIQSDLDVALSVL